MGKISDKIKKMDDKLWDNYYKDCEYSSSFYYYHPTAFWLLVIGSIIMMGIVFFEIVRAKTTGNPPYIGLFAFFFYVTMCSFVVFHLRKKDRTLYQGYKSLVQNNWGLLILIGILCLFLYSLFHMAFFRDAIPFLVEDDLLYYILIFGDLSTVVGLLSVLLYVLKKRKKLKWNIYDGEDEL